MSQLTPDEAVQKVRTAPASTCVSYAFAPDGRLLFRAGRRAGGWVAISLVAFLAACQPGAAPAEFASEPVQAEVVDARRTEVQPEPVAHPQLTTSASWPSAAQTTVDPPAPQPIVPQPQPVHRKPVRPPIQHLAGGIRAPGPDDAELR